LRGIKGHSDTGIIVTSSRFSDIALTEAAPSQNQRAIVLIDGALIVDTCFEKQIGVKVVDIQNLYEFDDTFNNNKKDNE
jgi:restriction endonuclease Mrr